MAAVKHPMQPIVFDRYRTARFKANEIVRYILARGEEHGVDLNHLARLDQFSQDDWNQFAQLIGYSVSGFGDLSYANRNTVAAADAEVERLVKERKAR